MRPKQINISEEKVSQVTKIFEQEYENPFAKHADKKKLLNTSSGAVWMMIFQKVYLIWLCRKK